MHHFQRKSYEYLMVKQGQNIRNTKTIYIKFKLQTENKRGCYFANNGRIKLFLNEFGFIKQQRRILYKKM